MDFKAPGIQCLRDPADVSPLAGGVPSLVGDDDRDLLPVQPVVKLSQMFLKPFQLGFIRLFLHGLSIQRDFAELLHLHQRKYVLQHRHRKGAVLHGNVDPLCQRLQHLKLRPFSGTGVHHIPRNRRGIGGIQIPVKDIQALFVVFILPSVRFIDAPSGVDVILQLADPLFLFLRTDVQEKFHDQISVVCELTLKAADTGNSPVIGLVVHGPHKAGPGHFVHPARIHEHKFSRFRDLGKIPPQKRFSPVLFPYDLHGRHLEKSRVYVSDHLSDGASLSGSTPSLQQDQYRQPVFLDLHLPGRQTVSRRLQAAFQFFLLRLFRQNPVSQHLKRLPDLFFLSAVQTAVPPPYCPRRQWLPPAEALLPPRIPWTRPGTGCRTARPLPRRASGPPP